MNKYIIELENEKDNVKSSEFIEVLTFPEAARHANESKNKRGFDWRINSVIMIEQISCNVQH